MLKRGAAIRQKPRVRRGFWQGRRAAASADRSASGPYRLVAAWPRQGKRVFCSKKTLTFTGQNSELTQH